MYLCADVPISIYDNRQDCISYHSLDLVAPSKVNPYQRQGSAMPANPYDTIASRRPDGVSWQGWRWAR